MYTVMVVDDEPAAVNYMVTMIERKCKEFQVVSTARNGQEALDKMEKLIPDVLIFDIRMPVVDGLTMSTKIVELKLPVIMVVVSGYSEFEYTRQALQNRVMDYLLKPVMPRDVEELFARISQRLKGRYYEERTRLLRKLCTDAEIKQEEIYKYFRQQTFYTALVRQNGLPGRFSAMNAREVFSDSHEILFTYGRDEQENLYLYPSEFLYQQKFEDIIMEQVKKEWTPDSYYTIILSKIIVSYKEIRDVVKRMYHILDHHVILGKTHTIYMEEYKEQLVKLTKEERQAISDINYLAHKGEGLRLRPLLMGQLKVWIKKELPLLWIERRIRNISMLLSAINKESIYDEDYRENEYALEEIFLSSYTEDQLVKNIDEILFQQSSSFVEVDKLDTNQFIQMICKYIWNHMDQEIHVHKISTEFGVSSTYLGKLFRKYKDQSLGTYITMVRMEKAKEMIAHDSTLLIKDIASRLGYKDQFYFSRVFRSYTGQCPSDFIESLKQES